MLYRGYPVQELAGQKSFEEVALLLWGGELPSEDELAAFVTQERAGRALAGNVRAVIDALPTSAHPMDVVRTAVSVIGANDPDAEDPSPEAELAKAKALFAALPAIVWVTLAYTSVFATAASFVLTQYAALRLPAAKVMAWRRSAG